MTTDPRLDELLDLWEDRSVSGSPSTPEELCADCPELLPELKRQIDVLAKMNRMLETDAGDESTSVGMGGGNRVPPGAPSKVFGDYELLEEIARGGMGVVYKARHIKLNRIVALKSILAGQFATKHHIDRFRVEAEAVAKLDHTGIVPIFDVGEINDQHYYAMGYVDGADLASKLADGPMPSNEAAQLMKDVAEAMGYAHDRGVIHRDLKPQNILLTTKGQPRVTDFGLAKQVDRDSSLTNTGQVLGTPSYMAPEQAEGKTDEIGVASDVYGLGAVLYRALTGRPPFESDRIMETLRQVKEVDPVDPRILNPAIPRDLATICLKCLQKRSDDRYTSAYELAAELQRYLDGEPIQARRINIANRALRWGKRKPYVAATVSLTIIAMIVGGLGLYAVRNAEHERNLNRLTGQIQAELDNLQLSARYLQQADNLVQSLQEVAPVAGTEAKYRLTRSFADGIRAKIRLPKLNIEITTEIQTALVLLKPRDPELAKDLESQFNDRLTKWDTLGELRSPFANKKTLFDAKTVQIQQRDNSLIIRQTETENEGQIPLIRTNHSCEGNVRCQLTITLNEGRLPNLGIVLESQGANGYWFRVSEPEADKADPADARQKTMSKTSTAPPVQDWTLQILRKSQVLAQQSIRLPYQQDGQLSLVATRVGDRLTFQINDEHPLVIRDSFPLTTLIDDRFCFISPEETAIQHLQIQSQPLPVVASALERGDVFFSRGEFAEALVEYQKQSAMSNADENRQESQYKSALCLVELKRASEATQVFSQLMTELGERWPILAAIQIWTTHLELGHFGEADAIFRNIVARHSLEEIAVFMPNDLRLRIVKGYQDVTEARSYAVKLNQSGGTVRAHNLKRLLSMQRAWNASLESIMKTKFSLMVTYLKNKRFTAALTVCDETLNHELASEELMASPRRRRWLMTYCILKTALGESEGALEFIDRSMEVEQGCNRAILIVERIRANAAMGKWDVALKNAEQFSTDITSISKQQPQEADDAFVKLHALCISGFVYEHHGRKEEARRAWKTAFEISQKLNQKTNITGAICGSLSNEINEQDVHAMLDEFSQGIGQINSPVMNAVKRDLIPVRYLSTILRNMWQSNRGREMAGKIVLSPFRSIDLLGTQIRLFMAELYRQSILDTESPEDQLPTEQEQLIWNFCTETTNEFLHGNISEIAAAQLFMIWSGFNNLSVWDKFKLQLKQELRGPMAYVLGFRYRQLKRPKEAASFFKSALEDAQPDSVLHKLATEELSDVANAKKGKPVDK